MKNQAEEYIQSILSSVQSLNRALRGDGAVTPSIVEGLRKVDSDLGDVVDELSGE